MKSFVLFIPEFIFRHRYLMIKDQAEADHPG